VNMDIRRPQQQRDKDIQHTASLSDSEDEGTGGRRNHEDGDAASRSKRKTKRPSIMDGGRHQDTPTDEEILARAPHANEATKSKDYITADAMDVDVKGEETSASGLL